MVSVSVVSHCSLCVYLQAWTAVQIFKGQYVCTDCYQLPLIQGSPMISDLEQLAAQPVQTWLRKSTASGEVSLGVILLFDDKKSLSFAGAVLRGARGAAPVKSQPPVAPNGPKQSY